VTFTDHSFPLEEKAAQAAQQTTSEIQEQEQKTPTSQTAQNDGSQSIITKSSRSKISGTCMIE
jgi:hypothetical protein